MEYDSSYWLGWIMVILACGGILLGLISFMFLRIMNVLDIINKRFNKLDNINNKTDKISNINNNND